MKRVITMFFFASLLLVACKSSKGTTASDKNAELSSSSIVESWILANERAKCSANSDKLCLQIKRGTSSNFEMLDAEIEGFTYEPGYKYQLEVKVTGSGASAKYSLVNELYKIPMK